MIQAFTLYFQLVNIAEQNHRIRRKREYELTKCTVLQITEEAELLANNPVIRESIRLRNPYVDPRSIFQVQLLKEIRAQEQESEEAPNACDLEDVLLTISGLALGLRNTG